MTEKAFVTLQKRLFVTEGVTGGTKRIGNTRSNHIIHIRDCKDTEFSLLQNQRLTEFVIERCENCKFLFLDSAVVISRTLRVIDSSNCEVVFECFDIRKVDCYNVKNTRFVNLQYDCTLENTKIFWFHGCENNSVSTGELIPIKESNRIQYQEDRIFPVPSNEGENLYFTYFDIIKIPHHAFFYANGEFTPIGQEHFADIEKFISSDQQIVLNKKDVIDRYLELEKTEFKISSKDLDKAYDEERNEYYDNEDELSAKIKLLADLIRNSKYPIFYTGAGVSTSAGIPDFRGPNGVWTMRDKGKYNFRGGFDQIYPTYSHYAITELTRRGLNKFVISTNMDALHLRSGLPKQLISEQHGNGNKERCVRCFSEFYRQYKVSGNSFNFRDHNTGRFCSFCKCNLVDTICHFSENLFAPDMLIAMHHARKSDLSIVLGTSMNVLPAACIPDKCLKNNGHLVIINLQKTPFDQVAAVRIFGKTDDVMGRLMNELGINTFDQETDKLFEWEPAPDPPKKIKLMKKGHVGAVLVAGAIALLGVFLYSSSQ